VSKGSGIRLALDQGIPRDAAARLRASGYNCSHVGELGMSVATDAEILAWAIEQNAAVVTLDADFHTILAVSGATAPSVIRLRIQGLDAIAVVALLQKVITAYESELLRGALVTVKAKKVTYHRLPVGGVT